ncbi:MAG: hypothetical protein V1776_02395 [Candidatus Diapherotrites archaeon]
MVFVWWRKMKQLSDSPHDHIYTEVQYDRDVKKIVNFVVIQLFEYDGVVYEVKKHDTAHGKYHIHCYYERFHSAVIETDEPITAGLFHLAKKDICDNWKHYHYRYARKYFAFK